MILGSVQICGERLSSLEVKDMCNSLDANSVRLLALRECRLDDKEYRALMKSVAECKSILQLNLNLGIVSSKERLEMLIKALNRNRSMTSLFVHGSPIGPQGVMRLCGCLASHPHIISLDLGDCQLTDYTMPSIAMLLPHNGAKRGLRDLILSGNPNVTWRGWTELFMAMARGCHLHTLCLDYNNLADYGAGCLAVALAACKKLENVDLEATGITEAGAQVLLSLIRSHAGNLKRLTLSENKIKASTKDLISSLLSKSSTQKAGSSDEESDSFETLTSEYTETDDTESTITDQPVSREKANLRSRSATTVQETSAIEQPQSESEYETDTGSETETDPYESIEAIVVSPKHKDVKLDQPTPGPSMQMRRSKNDAANAARQTDNSNRQSAGSTSYEAEEMQLAYQEALEKGDIYDKVRYAKGGYQVK